MKKVISFDYRSTDDVFWLELFHFIKAYKKKEAVEDDRDFNTFKTSFSDFFCSYPNFKFNVLLKDNLIVGTIESFPLNIDEEEEVQNIHVAVLDDEVFDKSESEIGSVISRWKKNFKKSKIETANNKLIQLLRNQGFKKGNKGVYFSLKRKKINGAFLEKVLNDPVVEDCKLNYSLVTELKEKEIIEVATIMTILLNDIKREDHHQTFLETPESVASIMRHHKKEGNSLYILLLRDQKGNLMGISILLQRRIMPKTANQFMTGVLKEYRSKGLSTWMKAFMYDELLKRHPAIEEVKTDCFVENTPIVHINKKFGFEETKRTVEMIYDRE